MIDYFSDRESAPAARTEEVIAPVVWAAIAGTVQGLINPMVENSVFPAVARISTVIGDIATKLDPLRGRPMRAQSKHATYPQAVRHAKALSTQWPSLPACFLLRALVDTRTKRAVIEMPHAQEFSV